MKKLSPIMFVGTGSDVGKSVITAGFCRVFKQDGYNPAPFKAQNMSNNSYVTEESLEMSHAQVVQAEAAGITATVDMNPIIIKPNSDKRSDVVVLGKSIGRQDAYTYFRGEGWFPLRDEAHKAYDRLSQQYSPMVLEGAGSVSEINLRERDMVNMPMAIRASANVVLIADIERGGIFASLYGSVMLMTEEERKHIKGIIINKFRGDLRLFESGIKMIEDLCKVPVLGVLPFYQNIDIEEEDSLQLARKSQTASSDPNKVNVAITLVRYLANFTEFSLLAKVPHVHLYYSDSPEELKKADVIIIPSSQSPSQMLQEFADKGTDKVLMASAEHNQTVMGIGNGYYAMGQKIIENGAACRGLGLLPIETTMQSETAVNTIEPMVKSLNHSFSNCYLLKQGEVSVMDDNAAAFASVNGEDNGVIVGHNFGSDIHGLLSHDVMINHVLKPYTAQIFSLADFKVYKNEQYDRLADHIRQYIDIKKVYEILS